MLPPIIPHITDGLEKTADKLLITPSSRLINEFAIPGLGRGDQVIVAFVPYYAPYKVVFNKSLQSPYCKYCLTSLAFITRYNVQIDVAEIGNYVVCYRGTAVCNKCSGSQ